MEVGREDTYAVMSKEDPWCQVRSGSQAQRREGPSTCRESAVCKVLIFPALLLSLVLSSGSSLGLYSLLTFGTPHLCRASSLSRALECVALLYQPSPPYLATFSHSESPRYMISLGPAGLGDLRQQRLEGSFYHSCVLGGLGLYHSEHCTCGWVSEMCKGEGSPSMVATCTCIHPHLLGPGCPCQAQASLPRPVLQAQSCRA